MAALQGANVVGADARCTPEGVSSLSAFLRVARPENDPDSLYLDLNVAETPYGVEPIDELQVLYDEWLNWVKLEEHSENSRHLNLFPNPAKNIINYRIDKKDQHLPFVLNIRDLQNRVVKELLIDKPFGSLIVSDLDKGVYLISLMKGELIIDHSKIVIDR